MAASAEPRIVMQFDPNAASKESDLFPRSGRGFTNKKSTVSGNALRIVTDPSAGRAIALSAGSRRGDTVSKSSLVHEGFDAGRGTTLSVSMDLKFNGGIPRGVFLADIECSDCWPKRSLLRNQSPGIRLFIDKASGGLAVDRGKIGFRGKHLRTSKRQPRLPVGRWFTLVWTMQLDQSDTALTRVLVDNQLQFEARGATLMDRAVFQRYGVKLGKTRYNYVEMGVTANESAKPVEVLLGKVKITLE